MANGGAGAPLSRREPGAARGGPGQSTNKRVLSDNTLTRIKAAIASENAQSEEVRPEGPNTEPIPRVTDSGSPDELGADLAPSPSGTEPEPETLPHRNPGKPARGASQPLSPSGVAPEAAAQSGQTARPDRETKPPRPDEPLRVAKALRVVEPDWPQAMEPPPADLLPPVLPAPRVKVAPAAEVEPPTELVLPVGFEPPTEIVLPTDFEPPTETGFEPPTETGFEPPSEPAPPVKRAPVPVGLVPPVQLVPPVEQAPPVAPAPPVVPLPRVERAVVEPAPPVAPAPPVVPLPRVERAVVEPAAPAPPTVPERAAQWPPKGTEPTPGSIGWLWPDEANIGGGGGRWRPPGTWRYRAVGLVVVGALVLAGIGVAIGISLHSQSTPPSTGGTGSAGQNGGTGSGQSGGSGPTSPLPSTSRSAATWITQQVAASDSVACDAQMCTALTAVGFPAAREVQVGTTTQSLSAAQVVVVTPQLRRYLRSVNSRLNRYVAPPALASFGGISVHAVAPNGATTYETQLSQDIRARLQAGVHLLDSNGVTATPSARNALNAGQVDSRILLLLQAVSDHEPVHILAFSDSGPEASPGVPFRVVDLAITGPGVGQNAAQYIATLRATLEAHANFPKWTSVGPHTMPDGTRAAQITYAAPSPVGLLAP